MFGGFTQFVIEGDAGVRMYEKITKAFDLCVEFDTHYEIDRVNGKVYTVKKSKDERSEGDVEYFFSVWVDAEPGDGQEFERSTILPRKVELKEGNLHIDEDWMAQGGFLRCYIADVKLHKTANIYYYVYDSCYAANEGFTNDLKGKYFSKPGYDFIGNESVLQALDNALPANYYDLSFEEQESICSELEEQGLVVGYYVTMVSDPEVFFGEDK